VRVHRSAGIPVDGPRRTTNPIDERILKMGSEIEFPEDFLQCVRFHGHLCPGLAIGYAAAKEGARRLRAKASEDEEIVAIVENDSCAVDAVQVILGCTFGKGNLIFRDWGKQVFTFIDREKKAAVRVAWRGLSIPGQEERHAIRTKIDAGTADAEDLETWERLKQEGARELATADPSVYFDVREVDVEMPPLASVVETRPCDECGEPTMVSRMVKLENRSLCRGCAS
jgi:formylmethanofuran dehydrogenase subunit E